jgi:hypothetical protein
MCERPIFPAKNEKELRNLVDKYRLHPEQFFPPVRPLFTGIWSIVKRVLLQMLDCNPKTRISAEEAQYELKNALAFV